ncbi:GATA transcription factor 9-like [Telopea speciosissima]|uniref:GATA transcription factor 9-like n=1 Tax=Telopea speciosissima TaxID=54955 RepID=UPI001CC68FEE|nr:GATA transcription factor 9-like [Telopea speciosissima]
MAMYESYKAGDFLDFTLDDFEEKENETKQMLSSGDLGSFAASLSGLPESQLCIPDDPIEDLEWFPNFADGSISLSGIPTSPDRETVSFSGFPKTPQQETEENINRETPRKGFDGHLRKVIPSKKPRSKRVGGRAWASMKGPSSLSLPESGVLAPEKSGGVVLGRRCTHCEVDNTPQWRLGPMGPKTLCNACGVRYKSGRLVPEYRPAASPSFNNGVHSNSHRKIMKLREVRYG